MWNEHFLGQDDYDALKAEDAEKAKKIQLLEEKVRSIEEHIMPPGTADNLSISSKLLLLHYSGALEAINLKRDEKALFLKNLLNTQGIENIKKYLSSLNNPKLDRSEPPFTITDLKRVYDLFEELGHTEACNKIHKDLEVLKRAITKF